MKGDLVSEVRELKEGAGEDMAILGSGSIISQLAQAGLIDEFQIVVNPVALGKGSALFDGIKELAADADEDEGVRQWQRFPLLRTGTMTLRMDG